VFLDVGIIFISHAMPAACLRLVKLI